MTQKRRNLTCSGATRLEAERPAQPTITNFRFLRIIPNFDLFRFLKPITLVATFETKREMARPRKQCNQLDCPDRCARFMSRLSKSRRITFQNQIEYSRREFESGTSGNESRHGLRKSEHFKILRNFRVTYHKRVVFLS